MPIRVHILTYMLGDGFHSYDMLVITSCSLIYIGHYICHALKIIKKKHRFLFNNVPIQIYIFQKFTYEAFKLRKNVR